ncbi:MAG: hemolysin family protein [Microthrixaceae bacterium]
MNLATGLVLAVVLVLANAFFVAAEFALVAVDRTRLDLLADKGNRAARVALGLLGRLSFNLSGAQLGITITSLALGLLTEPVFARALEPLVSGVVGDASALAISIVIALAVTTTVQMVLGELVPKSVAVAKPLESTLWLSRAFRTYAVVLRPAIAVCNSTANALLRVAGMEPTEELSNVRSREELRRLVATSREGGTIRVQTADLLDRTFRFGDKTVADALTPRPEVEALEMDGTFGDLLDRSAATGLSRFPVHDGDLDDVRGVVHVKDVLTVPRTSRRSEPLRRIVHPVTMVPESKLLDDMLDEFATGSGAHLAVVLDEYGATAGIITIEDLVEQIVGDIADEHDLDRGRPRVRRWRGAHLLSGRLHPDEVLEACGFEIPEGDYDTLAGFVLERLGRIPRVGDRFVEDSWAFEITEMENLRVATVRVVAPPPGLQELGGPA